MADYSFEEFRDHLATQMGVKGAGNTLSADDANYLEEIITNCHAELDALEVATWDEQTIPREVAEPLVQYCWGHVSKFGFDVEPQRIRLGLDGIRSITADRRHDVGVAQYF